MLKNNKNTNIETELRAEVSKNRFEQILSQLKESPFPLTYKKRLSVMFFGKVNGENIDIRIRITNGQTEIVIKKGNFHADDRIEISQSIEKNQFTGMVRLFSVLDFKTEIAEREIYDFNFKDGIVFSLIKAGDIYYIEIEKMSDKDSIEKIRKQLLDIMDKWRLKCIDTKNGEVLENLCNRLSNHCDWQFKGSENDFQKLQELLNKY